MIRFKSLTLRNFLSFGNAPTIIVLDRPGTTLVLGENLDSTESGTGQNGVGKTCVINALVYGVFDKPLSNISKDNLVNNVNKKNMQVTVEFEKNGIEYTITRARKMKAGAAGNYVVLKKDGKDITPDSVSNTNALIEKIIGIPYELFVRIVAFSATHSPFLDLPVRSHYAANQTDIIEELFDLKTLSEKALNLKEQTKEKEAFLAGLLKEKEARDKEHERHEKQLISARRRVENWKIQNADEIKDIQHKLSKVRDINIAQQKNLHDELSDVDSQLREAMREQQALEKAIRKATADVKNKKNELAHLEDAKCPYCLQQYQDAVSKINETKESLKEHEDVLAASKEEHERAEQQVEVLASRHKDIKAQITVSDLDELLDIRGKVDHYEKRLTELQEQDNPFLEPLKELEDVELDEVDNEEINELQSLIEHQKFLLKLLTKKDSFVRKALLNKNIPFLNQRLARYLTELGLPHTVEFTHEMTASISQFGRPLDFGNLSNGQRARVNLALSFAFRDVLQNLHEHINVCMLDEVLDVGLDAIGVQAAARMLKHKARGEGTSMFIVSHRDEIDSAFTRRMVVQMSKGFSYIRFDE